jgi:hypothetical protein
MQRKVSKMKDCSSLAAMSIMPASIYLMSSNMTDAAFSHGNGITALELAIALLVGALYTANHFKGRIKTFFKHLSSKSRKG